MSALSGTDQQQQESKPKGTTTTTTTGDDDRNPLHRAASAGQVNLVRQMLEADSVTTYPIDCPDSLGWTPLIIAASAGHREVVAYLLERGADASALTANSQSALHFACGKGHLEIVKLLVESGRCPLNSRDRFGYTPFIRAVLANRVSVVEYLLASPAGKIDLDGKDKLGNSALHIACEEENVRMIQILLEAGADVKAANSEERTPLECVTNQKLQRQLKDVFVAFGRPREAGAPAPVFKLSQLPSHDL